MSNEINRMDLKEFMEKGFLQEANRQFFHPLGLALEVIIEDDGTVKLGGVWDYRDDPEGLMFGKIEERHRIKAENVEHLRASKVAARISKLGAVIQSIDKDYIIT